MAGANAAALVENIVAVAKVGATNQLSEHRFLEMVNNSCEASEPLDLSNMTVDLTRAVRLKRNQSLVIFGGTITGGAHSLFQMDTDKSHIQLILRGTTLIHTAESDNPRDIGGAIFVMGSAIVHLDGCKLHSVAGFGVWAKHQAKVVMHECKLQHIGRTAVACFNDTSVDMSDTLISDCGVHGVCVRGKGKVSMVRSEVLDCETRGVYAYQKATVTMEECAISGTKDPEGPAVHAQAQLDNSTVTLKMTKCRVVDNAGPSVLIEGRVAVKFRKNVTSTDAVLNSHVPPPAPPSPLGKMNSPDNADREDTLHYDEVHVSEEGQTPACRPPESMLSCWFPDFLCACRSTE